MLVLGIDSSGKTASAALCEDQIVLAEYTVDLGLTHSQTLLPMVAEIFSRTGKKPAELGCIAVSAGPGSFTGLRIGAATGKGIALAYGTPMAEISTLEALAYNVTEADAVVRPIMDARRAQVYTAAFRHGALLEAEEAVGIEALIVRVNESGEPQLFLGDGVPVYKTYIEEHIRVPYRFVNGGNCLQRASSVALLGAKKAAEGNLKPSGEFTLSYIRKPQAEREREAHGLHVYDIAH